ncbi:MAG: UbiA prenyltransferase family protein [Lentisphaeria bacterium]|nr:UbiA prenyltransferase family protein [Lentisphaeria bacterium]
MMSRFFHQTHLWSKQLRCEQWIKNIFIFAPLVFAGKFFSLKLLLCAGKAFCFFSLSASCCYLLNDILDIKDDRKDELKKKRPLADGKLHTRQVATVAIILFIITGTCSIWFMSEKFQLILAFYFLLNLLYSTMRIRNTPPLDILCISAGFICRVLAGSTAVDIQASQWLLAMTFLLTLILALGKRFSEQKNQFFYTEKYILFLLPSLCSILLAFYTLYIVLLPPDQPLYSRWTIFTIFPVAGAILYYISKFFSSEKVNTDPSFFIFHDKKFSTWIILWILSIFLIIYVK